MIQLAQEEDVEALYQQLDSDKILELCKKYCNITENENGSMYASIWCAYGKYKVYSSYSFTAIATRREFVVIPIENENGYYVSTQYFSESSDTEQMMSWSVAECKNGIFEGSFCCTDEWHRRNGKDLTVVTTGNLKNGFYDGIVIEDTSTNTIRKSVAYYEMGKPEIYEKIDNGDGKYIFYYEYGIDESGNAVLNSDGTYASKSGGIMAEEQIDSLRMYLGGSNIGFEIDGAMCYYQY